MIMVFPIPWSALALTQSDMELSNSRTAVRFAPFGSRGARKWSSLPGSPSVCVRVTSLAAPLFSLVMPWI